MEVETRNGVQHTVRVVPSWRERGVLQLELTQDNLDLLLEEPRAADHGASHAQERNAPRGLRQNAIPWLRRTSDAETQGQPLVAMVRKLQVGVMICS